MVYVRAETEGQQEMLERFGLDLRRCRHHLGLSQVKLAHLSGVPRSTISRLERGRAARVPVIKIVQLSDAMGRWLPMAYCPHDHACAWKRRHPDDEAFDAQRARDNELWFKTMMGGA